MKINAIISSGLALTTLTCGALWMQSRSLQRTESTERPYRESLLHAMEQQQQQDARARALDDELTRLQTELADAEQSRHAAEQRIETLEDEIRNPKVLPDYFAQRLAGIPGKDGKYGRLISPTGHIHAEDVVYSSRNGSQLTFKVAGRPVSFMASQIHPAILADLGLSLEALRADQKRLNAEKSARFESAQAASQARILTFASMMQRERAKPVPVETPAATTASQLQPTPKQLRELIARQRAFDRQQQAQARARSAANGTVTVMGPPSGYGGGQQRPRCQQPSR